MRHIAWLLKGDRGGVFRSADDRRELKRRLFADVFCLHDLLRLLDEAGFRVQLPAEVAARLDECPRRSPATMLSAKAAAAASEAASASTTTTTTTTSSATAQSALSRRARRRRQSQQHHHLAADVEPSVACTDMFRAVPPARFVSNKKERRQAARERAAAASTLSPPPLSSSSTTAPAAAAAMCLEIFDALPGVFD